MSKRRYTIPNRIDDIISLIQILAFANKALRTETGLTADLGKPKSAKTWEEIAQTHSEFFRYSKASQYFTLIARYTTPKIIEGDPPKSSHAPISNELVKELLNIAVILHDKEVKRNEHWKIWLPPVLAGIPAIIAIFIAIKLPTSSENLKFKMDILTKQVDEMKFDLSKKVPCDSIHYQETKIKNH